MNHPPLQEILMTNFKTLAALMMTALMAAGTASAADGKIPCYELAQIVFS